MFERSLLRQFLIGWLPLGVLFGILIIVMHGGARPLMASHVAFRMMISAAILALGVPPLVRRLPWTTPVRAQFVATHLILALLYAFAWIAFNSAIESVVLGSFLITIGDGGLWPFVLLGIWLYFMIIGVVYTNLSTQRAAHAEALASKSQLAALRSQLQPHFLFNALHSVIHLIPREPARAAEAAERLGDLLRITVEDDRELVPFVDEMRFVRAYLDLERIRFGERLVLAIATDAILSSVQVPIFSVQTLVENAVRHGAAPSIDSTTITIAGTVTGDVAAIEVRDTGVGAALDLVDRTTGTGLRRLRERLRAHYGNSAALKVVSTPAAGFTATMLVPFVTDVE